MTQTFHAHRNKIKIKKKKKITVWGISGQPLERYFTQPLACSWGDFHFCHSFLIVPEIPTSLPEESTFACP
jgi:hypothetical protein